MVVVLECDSGGGGGWVVVVQEVRKWEWGEVG